MKTPIGAMFSGVAVKKILVEFILITSAAVVFIGVGLISSLLTHEAVWSGTYGYLVAVVLGCGIRESALFHAHRDVHRREGYGIRALSE
jgi:hypothetical protein